MFVSINFYFLQDEFLCSSLSFFEDKALIQCINKCHFGVVKIVSVSLPMFTWKKVPKKSMYKREYPSCSQQHEFSSNSCKDSIFLLNQRRPCLFKTTYAPKTVDVHTFSEKLKDVTEKTNIRQIWLMLIKINILFCLYKLQNGMFYTFEALCFI